MIPVAEQNRAMRTRASRTRGLGRSDVTLRNFMETNAFAMQVLFPGYRPGGEERVADQRRSARFQLQLPVLVVRDGNEPVQIAGETRNLSSSGVLMVMQGTVAAGGSIEYVVTLTVSGDDRPATRIYCKGRVLRNERTLCAATIDRYTFLRDGDLPGKENFGRML